MSTEIIYGTNAVLEVLRAGRRRCHEVVISAGRRETTAQAVERLAAALQIPVRRVAREAVAAFAKAEKHQGIAARVEPFVYQGVDDLLSRELAAGRAGFVLILDGITDPHNFGSLIRTASLMGVQGVIVPQDRMAPVSPVVVKASAGATEYLPVARVPNISETIRKLKGKGFWVFGADADGHDSLYSRDFQGLEVAIVLGAEGTGMRRLVRERCDGLLSIPMQGVLLSYNVSVAGALIMGEVARQRISRASAGSPRQGLVHGSEGP